MALYDLGDQVELTIYVTTDAGVAAAADTVTCTITLPDGTTATPTPTTPATGTYTVSYAPTVEGRHAVKWAATAIDSVVGENDVEWFTFRVRHQPEETVGTAFPYGKSSWETAVSRGIGTVTSGGAPPGFGELSVTAAAATSFTDDTSYVPLAGTWALTAESSGWDESAGNGQLTFTGTGTPGVHVAASMSITSSANNQVVYLAIAKNGTVLTPSITSRKISTGADVGAVAVHAFTTVTAGDSLQIVVRDSDWSGAETVTASQANLFAMDMM